jgi:hypothetical protein
VADIKIKIFRTIIFRIVSYGCEAICNVQRGTLADGVRALVAEGVLA